METIHTQKGLRGRATTVYRGKYWYTNAPENQKSGVLKDAWPDDPGSHEVEWINEIKQDPGRPGQPYQVLLEGRSLAHSLSQSAILLPPPLLLPLFYPTYAHYLYKKKCRSVL